MPTAVVVPTAAALPPRDTPPAPGGEGGGRAAALAKLGSHHRAVAAPSWDIPPPRRISHRSDEQQTLSGTHASTPAEAAEAEAGVEAVGSTMHAVAMERVERMFAHHA